jgi:hypothetical protein
MSRTTLYKVPEKGGIEVVAEFRNSHGSAPYIWSKLGITYFGWEEYGWYSKDMNMMWKLAKDHKVHLFERVTLMTTFDRIIAAFILFVEAHPFGNYVCSLPDQAVALRRLIADPDCFAVCWNQTSVANNWPQVYDEGCCECCLDDGRSYDISLDKDHYFMFNGLDE